jgi:hypothetical protein
MLVLVKRIPSKGAGEESPVRSRAHQIISGHGSNGPIEKDLRGRVLSCLQTSVTQIRTEFNIWGSYEITVSGEYDPGGSATDG